MGDEIRTAAEQHLAAVLDPAAVPSPPPVEPLPPYGRYYSDAHLIDRVAHHPPTSAAIVAAHTLVRSLYGDLLVTLNGLLAEGMLKQAALDDLISNMQQVNACIAVHQLVHGPLPVPGGPAAADGEVSAR